MGVSPTHLGPRKPAGVPGQVLQLLGPPLAVLVLGGRGRRGEVDGEGLSRIGGSGGSAPSISPTHSGSREPAGLPSLVLCPLRPPLAVWVLEV